jgi:FG-GAP-like repeat/FG-GAP repeat
MTLLLSVSVASADFVQQGVKLVGDPAAQFGSSVALSADGNVAIVGETTYNSGAGASYVFVRNGGVWTLQTGLIATGAIGGANQGYSVALSADGSTALVGGPADNADDGAAWVFTHSAAGWAQQGKLFGTGASVPEQGWSVALSADGNTAIVGGPNDAIGAGAAWVFTRSAGGWTQQGPKLVGDLNARFGESAALSADGNTAIVGEPFYNLKTGSSGVFVRNGGVWTVQTGLIANDAIGNSEQGFSVALSADGNTALVGGPEDNNAVGAAWVFTRSAGGWTQQGPKLVGIGATGVARQGYSVALSGDGNTAIVGGLNDNSSLGAAWVFTRNGTVWTQRGSKLVGAGATGVAFQGYSVALSGDGKTAMVGGPGDNSSAGGAWVFIWPRTATHDYNADGKSDLNWRDGSGNLAFWVMNGAVAASSGGTGGVPAAWSIVGQRDFNRDGKADLLWRDTSGNTAMWFMSGAAVGSSLFVGNIPATWSVIGTGDFNGDGFGDIIWRDNNGNVAVWLMNGVTVSSSRGLGNVPLTWNIVGTGDYDGDGMSDILWRDNAGNTAIWFMSGTAVASSAPVGNTPTNWSVVGTGDFDGNGKSDIVWRDNTGNTSIWLMNGAAIATVGGLGNIPTTWSIVQTGDYNGDGMSDLLWRDNLGNTSMWFMNGVTVPTTGSVGNIPTVWNVQAANAE